MNKEIPRVEITASCIQEDLNNGYTWFKRDDLGFGSIQEKYGAIDRQINNIKRHPLLKDYQTISKIFVIIDDITVHEAPAFQPVKLAVCNDLSTKMFQKDPSAVLDVHTYETPLAVHKTLDIDDGGAKAAFDNL